MLVSSKEVFNKQANYYNKKLHPFKGKAGRNKMGLLVGAWWPTGDCLHLPHGLNRTKLEQMFALLYSSNWWSKSRRNVNYRRNRSWVIHNTLTSSKFFPESVFTITPIDFLVRSNSRVATLLAALLHHWQHPSNSSSSSNYYLFFKEASGFFFEKKAHTE